MLVVVVVVFVWCGVAVGGMGGSGASVKAPL